MNRIDRLFAITLLLQRKRRIRASDLAQIFEVSERTIYRDMLALNESGVPIVSIPGEGYELMQGYFLPPLVFTPNEARSLFLSAKMLMTHSKGQLPGHLQTALDKIGVALPENSRQDAERLAEVISFMLPKQQFDLDELKLSALQKAIQERRVVWIKYHGQNRNQITEREIEAHKLTYSEDAWYVDGYCRLRSDLRGFRLDRIDELRLTRELFEPRKLAASKPQPKEVQIRFAQSIVRWVREQQHYGFVGEKPTKGGVVMTYRVDDFNEIKPWLLGWGAGAEALSSPDLRQMIEQELRQSLSHY